ncbi:glutamate-5-semialdehyde dehydrogenase [Candidatus Profftia tarda]|uniref:Gamma-glutamyl phosphate reductase n=1 Tax=Candidatus Profftia tarda TaxID=1177216 RepID=A0A8E4EY85_9ENTR|nr:glutamate-5-semialdehyde dehydrogenase [Candidatus Profftia tarda]CAD6506869.1 Gamma-glutamyl phosphate reductase [Candidatus Profftia tarda]
MLEKIGQNATNISYDLAILSSERKNNVLSWIAHYLDKDSRLILEANNLDIQEAFKNKIAKDMLKRLALSPESLLNIANDVRQICGLEDPVGKLIHSRILNSGLHLECRCVPLGVVAIIYESRPNVTINSAVLCFKTGNAVILRGGKEAYYTNKALIKIIHKSLDKEGLSRDAVQAITSTSRDLVGALLKLDRYIDILIPRGGAGLHKLCREQSTIPVITGGIGVCHIYLDEGMDCEQALKIIVNAKAQHPSMCNTVETLLVHQHDANYFLQELSLCMHKMEVSLHGCPRSLPILSQGPAVHIPLKDADLDQEWLSLDLNVMVVDGLDDAIKHIRHYGSHHSDAILTRNTKNANRFVREVDSSAVYVNASTRFTDGGQFGLGAEIAVSTQKLHARGPMGLDALTTYKWIGSGNDLVRI